MRFSRKTRLGTYEILGPLGAGGMGEVYRAKDLRLGREIAIKVLPSDIASSPDSLTRFEREARMVAGLNHPNIVTLHSVEDVDGVRFLTMELIEGQSLTDLISPGGLPLARIFEVSIPLTDALVAAHERGVIHRDLKPGNIMVMRDGRVKILDFGLAKIAGVRMPAALDSVAPTVDCPLTGQGQVLGTVPYMAPEQIQGEAADARSDLFALGIVLYEMATGRRPFTGKSPVEVASSILRDTPEPLSRARADLPRELERLISRCLEKNPRERAQSALDLSNELRRLRRALERGASEKETSVVSIAVLPFVNRSAGTEDEYFSDGLTDELLNVLAKIRGLRVAARTSAFHFKGKDTTIAEVGSALNVATVLEGSVRKAGNRVRISVQLVKVADGYHLWSETYDRTLDDIFAVQDDIAQSVVKELRTTLLGKEADSDASQRLQAEVAIAAKGHGRNTEAHRLYLQGKHFMDRLTPEDAAHALKYLNEAVNLDPTHVSAWLEISRVYAAYGGHGWASVDESYRKSRAAVDRALELAPDSAEAHARLANIQMNRDFDWKSAENSLRRALELSPSNNPALRSSGSLALVLCKYEEAAAFLLRAVEQDPLNSFAYASLGIVYLHGDRLVEGETMFRKALELAPQRAIARSNLALNLTALGRGEEALAEAIREPQQSFRLFALAIAHHGMKRHAESDAALGELIQKHAEEAAFQIAGVYGERGEADKAFEWLDRARLQGDTGLAFLRAFRHFHRLHDDPRWGPFLKKMALEE